MHRSLPPRASLESLRKEAKRLLRSYRAGEAEARSLVAERLPNRSSELGLREVQQALARDYGFETWAALKDHVELAVKTPADLVEEFLRCACLSSEKGDWPSQQRRAERLRLRHPELARANLHAACVAGELELVRDLLGRDPSAATQRGKPQSWEPILFVCFGRIDGSNAVPIARLLLEHGANPDAEFVTFEKYRHRALTGVIGYGELGLPPHPHARELAELLLAHGANPNDSQAIYNEMLEGDRTEWLELLLAHGLKNDDIANWQPDQPMSIVDFAFAYAAKRGQRKRALLLLQHGADPDTVDSYNGKRASVNALLAGHDAIAELIVEHGGERVELSGYDAFLAACMREDASAARALLEGHPEYLEDIDPLIEAIGGRRVGLVRMLLELGMDPNRPTKHGTFAINLACGGDDGSLEIALLLLARGADPNQLSYGGTPAGWALFGISPGAGAYARRLALARVLAERSRSVHDATRSGHLDLLRELLAEDRHRARLADHAGATPLHCLPDDEETALAVMDLLLAHGADPQAANHDGRTPAETLEKRGLDELADALSVRTAALSDAEA